MNNINVTGTVNFMGKEIPSVTGGFGENRKCVSDRSVADIHNMRISDVRRRINDNIRRFKNNIDYIDLKKGVHEAHTYELLSHLGYSKQSILQAEHIYILSERGYAKLIKIMDTDKAWEIHDKLVDDYFSLREQANRKYVDFYNLPQDKNAYVNSLVTQLQNTGDYKNEYDVFSSVYKTMREKYQVDVNEHKLLYSLQNPFEYNISTWKVVKHNPALYNLFVTVLNELVKNTNLIPA